MKAHQISVITSLVDWIENNLDSDLSLDRLGARSGYTKWHIARMFSDVVGLTPCNYIKRRRLTRLYHVIRENNGKFTLTRVTEAHGFQTQTDVCRNFLHYFGFTPKEVISRPAPTHLLVYKFELKK